MNEYKVTVIVPVYNAENYIKKCISSLFSQTLKNVEYIFINDASTDKSFEIVKDEVSRSKIKDDIILIENKVNLGVAKTRQKGLDIASGKYVIQIDSDDYIDNNMLSILYNLAESTNADVAVCDYHISFLNGKNKHIIESYTQDSYTNTKNILLGKIHPSFGNSMIKRKFYQSNSITLSGDINMGEDYEFMLKIFSQTNKVSYISKPLLYYTQYNMNSMTKTMNKSHIQNIIVSIDIFENIIKKTNLNLEEEFKSFVLFWKRVFVLDHKNTHFFYEIKPEVNKLIYLFNFKGYSLIQKIVILFTILKMPFITRFVYNSYRKIKKYGY